MSPGVEVQRRRAGRRSAGSARTVAAAIALMIVTACSNGQRIANSSSSAAPLPTTPPGVGLPAPAHGHYRSGIPRTVIASGYHFGTGDQNDHGWAGYADLVSGPDFGQFFSYVEAWFQVPPLDQAFCKKDPFGQIALWVGLDGAGQVDDGQNVEQTGVLAACSSLDAVSQDPSGRGAPTYTGWWETLCPNGDGTCYPHMLYFDHPQFTVLPGDTMFAAVREDYQGRYTFVLVDYTQSFNLTADVPPQPCPDQFLDPPRCPRSSAEAIVEDPSATVKAGSQEPVAPFGLASFWGARTGLSVGNPQPVVSSGPMQSGHGWTAAKDTIVDGSGHPVIEPSSIGPDQAADGGSQFWVYQYGTPPAGSPSCRADPLRPDTLLSSSALAKALAVHTLRIGEAYFFDPSQLTPNSAMGSATGNQFVYVPAVHGGGYGNMDTGATCEWVGSPIKPTRPYYFGYNVVLNVSILPYRTASLAAAAFDKARSATPAVKAVTGVGDEAYFGGPGLEDLAGELAVRTGRYVASIAMQGPLAARSQAFSSVARVLVSALAERSPSPGRSRSS